MGKMNVAQDIHIVPVRATTTDTATFIAPHINMKLYDKVEFLVIFGTLSGGSNVLTVTQSAVTAGSTSTAIAARYRMPAAAGTDTMGDVTTLASTGLTLTFGTFTTKGIIVDVDSSDMTTADLPYVGLTFTGANSATSTIWALCWPKYPQETNSGALT
uniref:Uncharacterized protein n=1 Tax=viral metagenome TaxID=1070528 RepID=A0A6M3KK51_9ZZZZ